MIIDYQADAGHAHLYEVLDATTGECLSDSLPLFHADDEAGIYRIYLKDDAGLYYLIPGTEEVAWEERRPANGIRIALKAEHAAFAHVLAPEVLKRSSQ